MAIIINGGSRRAGSWWAKHLGNETTNERAEVIEYRGLSAETMLEAFDEMYAVSRGTKCENFFYQANINPEPGEQLTPAQWRKAVDTLEKNLGLAGQPRFVVEHEKHGRVHQHVVWSRIDSERMIAIPDSLTAKIHERTSRELEITFGLERGRSILTPDRDFERPERRPKKHETMRALDGGIDPRVVKAEVSALWRSADSAQAFKAALEEKGYILARGDRRDFVLIDRAGDDHSLGRRAGVKAAELRARMKEIDPATLPSVTEARAQQRELAAEREHYDRDAADAAWMDKVARAAIAKEEAAPAIAPLEPENVPAPEAHRYDPLRFTEQEVARAQFKGRYDELRAAELPSEVVHLFEVNAARFAEPPAVHFDRDGADAAWLEKVAAAGIAAETARQAQDDRPQPATAAGGPMRAREGEAAYAPPEARESAQQVTPDYDDPGIRSIDNAGARILGGIGKAMMSVIGALADMFSPPPKLSRDQAERAQRVAGERRDQHAVAADHQAALDHHAMLAEERRTKDIARTLQVDPVFDPEEDRFRRIMQRAARDNERDREYERER